MSGLAGLVRFDGGPADPALIARMLDYQKHRGPDGPSVHAQGRWAFGFCANRTTPESRSEVQPLLSGDRSLVLVADARLDNRNELRSALEAHGFEGRTHTDAELILGAYQIWEKGCAARLLGDFAFVIWDAGRQRLFCAVDPCGIRPLFYAFDGRSFRWASELKALLVDPGMRRELNREALADALLCRRPDTEETFCRGILRLLPACRLTLEGGTLAKGRYWDVDPESTINHRDPRDYVEQYRELLGEAVRARLRATAKVGVWLSGGLDSASIACLAGKLAGKRGPSGPTVEAFSAVYAGFSGDEREFVADVARQSGMRVNYFEYRDLAKAIPEEGPANLHFFVFGFTLDPAFRQAREDGVRVMLDGFGGDDFFADYRDIFADWAAQGRWGRLVRELSSPRRRDYHSLSSILRQSIVGPYVPASLKNSLRRLRAISPDRDATPWVNPKFVVPDPPPDAGAAMPAGPAFRTRSHGNLYRQFIHGFNLNRDVPAWTQSQAFHGIETRHPFYDRRVIEFMFTVPLELHWSGFESKVLLRRGMDRILPDSVRTRAGKSNAQDVHEWELQNRQFDRLERLLEDSVLVAEGILLIKPLRELVDLLRVAARGVDDPVSLLSIVKLETWCRDMFRIPTNTEVGEHGGAGDWNHEGSEPFHT